MTESNEYPTLHKIQQLYPQMTTGQQQMADYILQNPSEAASASITDLISHTSLKSEASAVKFYRLLGFKSFKAFKLTLAQELVSRTFYQSQTDITFDDSPQEIKAKVYQGAANSLNRSSSMNDDSFLLTQQLLSESNRIIILGQGASSPICQYAYFRFSELGLNCIYNADPHMNALFLSHLQNKDCIFCVSQSGETADLYKQVELAYRYHVPTILITGSPRSSIAKLSKAVISIEIEEHNVLTEPLNSRVTQFCTIDVIFSILSVTNSNKAIPNLQETRNIFKTYKLN